MKIAPAEHNNFRSAGQTTGSPADYVCKKGFKCPTGATHPVLCAATTFQQNVQEDTCDTCPEGVFVCMCVCVCVC